MFKLRKTRIGREKGFFAFLHRPDKESTHLKEFEISSDERRDVRIYIELPIRLDVTLNDGSIESFQGKTINISAGGVLLQFWAKIPFWKKMEHDLEKVLIRYRFIFPEEITGESIEGVIRRHFKKINKHKQLVELEIGVQNLAVEHRNRMRVLRFINKYILKGINEDIAHIEKIKAARDLTDLEHEMYRFLLSERKSKMKDRDTDGEPETET